jgi:retron-type reverse transcriptase
MKRHGNLYKRVIAFDNLQAAYEHASKGKKHRPEVQEFALNLDANLREIGRELEGHAYHTSDYAVFTKYEPKERLIYKLPFRDRVVHWAIMLVIQPIWVSNFTRDAYACVKGRGIHPCLNKLRRDMRADPVGTAYCLKLDVRKFYPSIDHDILKRVIRVKIKDPDLLWLLDEIIDSAGGVPIGNYLSQFFANLYLSELDHLLKERLKARYYYRYADDIVLLGADKGTLSGHLVFINDYLNSERALDLKRNYQVYPVESRGIDFVGYVTRHACCLARKRNKQNLCREVSRARKRGLPEGEIRLRLASRLGFMYHCDSNHLLNTIGMKKFSDVQKAGGNLEGSKVKIDSILNRTLQLTGYTTGVSRYHDTCLTMQFKIEEQVLQADGTARPEWVQHICFTGSQALVRQLQGVEINPDDPPFCKIIKQNLDGGRCFYKIVDPD